MPPKKKGKKKPTPPPPEEDTSPKGLARLYWNLTALIVLAGGITLIIAACLPSWRVVNSTTYRFTNPLTDKLSTTTYGPTYFGLFTHKFNNGAISRPISQSAVSICAVTDFQASGSLWDYLYSDGCGTTCTSHLQTRCAVYRKLSDAGYITLAGMVSAGLLYTVGGVWNLVLGRSYTVMLSLWGFASLGGSALLIYWWWITGDELNRLGANSQFPTARIGAAAIIAGICVIAGSTGLILAALGWTIGDYFDFQARKEEVDMHLLYDGGGQMGAFGGPGNFGNVGPGGGGMMMPLNPGQPQQPRLSISQQQQQQQFMRMMQQQQQQSPDGYSGRSPLMMQQQRPQQQPPMPMRGMGMPPQSPMHGMGMPPQSPMRGMGMPPQQQAQMRGMPQMGGAGRRPPQPGYGMPPGYM